MPERSVSWPDDGLGLNNLSDNKSFVINYFHVAGDDEGSNAPHPDKSLTYSHCNFHDGTFFNDSSTRIKDILDGTSHTAFIAESWGRSWVDSWGNSYPDGSSSA